MDTASPAAHAPQARPAAHRPLRAPPPPRPKKARSGLRRSPEVRALRPARAADGKGIPRAKVTENVEAELIGVVLDECVKRFGRDLVREYDTTSFSPKAVAREIARGAKSAARPSARSRRRARRQSG